MTPPYTHGAAALLCHGGLETSPDLQSIVCDFSYADHVSADAQIAFLSMLARTQHPNAYVALDNI